MFRKALPISAVLALALLPAHGAPRWKLQYFYDEANSELHIRDIQCPSPHRCVAAGELIERQHVKGVELVSDDDGVHWSLLAVKERPQRLFFLNEKSGWMATDKGIWRSDDAGQTWNKLQKLEGIGTLYFLDADKGFAAGVGAYATSDGGRKWESIAAAGNAKAVPQIVFTDIAFHGGQGYMLGSPVRQPAWLNPDRARLSARQKTLSVLLATTDGGVTWTRSEQRVDGSLARVFEAPNGAAYGLYQFSGFDKQPSALYQLDRAHDQHKVYSEPGRTITDLHALPDGTLFLAEVEVAGKLNDIPIPGKLRVVCSSDTVNWSDMDVDYRAVAHDAMLAGPDAQHLFLATDTGMILKLVDRGPDQNRP